MIDELSIGLIGAGRMGAYHVETWERVEAGRLVAVAEPEEALARARIGRRPIDWVADYRWLLERADLDAVCICTPSEQHARIALDALDAGKHVFVEKPIATALEDGLRMAAAARVAGLKLMVGHVERFNPAVGKLSELIREGRIGRVFRAHATRVGPLPARIQDTGVAIDLATHDLDLMQFVLGRDITSIYAEGSRCVHPSQEDMISCLLRFGEDSRAARRQLADAREAPRDDGDRGGRHAQRLLPHAGRVVHRVLRSADRVERVRPHPRRRGGRRGALRPAPRRAAAGRAGGVRPLRAG